MNSHRKFGIVLAIVLIVFLVFSVLSLTLVFLSSNQLQTMKETEYNTRAHYIAYSGIMIAENYITDVASSVIIYGYLSENGNSDTFNVSDLGDVESFDSMRTTLEASASNLGNNNNLFVGIYKMDDSNFKVLSRGNVGEFDRLIAMNYQISGGSVPFPGFTNLFDHVLFGGDLIELGKSNGNSKVTISGPIGTNATDTIGIDDNLDSQYTTGVSTVTIGTGGNINLSVSGNSQTKSINYETKDFETVLASFTTFFDSISSIYTDTLTIADLSDPTKNGFIGTLYGTVETGNSTNNVRYIITDTLGGTGSNKDLTVNGDGLLIIIVKNLIKTQSAIQYNTNSENVIVFYEGTNGIEFKSAGFNGMLIVKNNVSLGFNTNGQNTFNGLFFAPYSTVDFTSANADLLGAVIADKIYAEQNNTSIIYDADLVDDFLSRLLGLNSGGGIGTGGGTGTGGEITTTRVWSR